MLKMYIQGSPVSLEEGTSDVPDDGKYHIVLDGEIVKSYRSLTKAKEAYRALLEEVDFEPEGDDADLDYEAIRRRERIDVDYYRVEDYWANAHNYRSGGKLRNR